MCRILLVLLLMLYAAGCIPDKSPPGSKPIVVVSIPPQKYLLEKITDTLFDILVLVPPGSSPHSYEPKPSQMSALARASLLFTIGIEFEHAWLPRITANYPGIRVVHTDSGITKMPINEYDSDKGDNGHESEHQHNHEGLDPHIWLSPELVKSQVELMYNALREQYPAYGLRFGKGYRSLLNEIDTLQKSIHALVGTRKNVPFLVFHPSWGYFAREFGLRQIAIESEGKEPGARQLAHILETARVLNIKTVFVQPQFSDRTVRTISSTLAADIKVADPLAYDWNNNLMALAAMFRTDR